MADATTAPTFAPGSVIATRNRLWRVDGQPEPDVLVASTIDGGEAQRVKLYVPFEDIQPGALAPPAPDRVGTIQAQDLLLRAYRLNLLHGTAPLLSLQRSRVIPKDYQLVPVVMALEMPRVRMLIADDVGLGKTIEAGLIATELLARQLVSRMLVIVPASLREQWREALDYFFHIPARIISTRHRREMERELPAGANPWEAYPFLITSVDYAKQPAIKNQILEQRWDLVIIDEAHQVAKPHQSGPDQSVSMDRWELAEALAGASNGRRSQQRGTPSQGLSGPGTIRHLLLLTATPHNGYTDTFASLLRMLDVGAVEGPPHAPQILREMAARHVCQRRRVDVEAWFEAEAARGHSVHNPFPKREQREVIVPPTAYEMDAIRAVEAYGQQVLDQAAAGSAHVRTLAHWTVLHFHKRALSSPEALRCSLRNRRKRLRQVLQDVLPDVTLTASAGDTPVPEDAARANVLDEDTGERLSDEEVGARTERLIYGTPDQIGAELQALDEVLTRAEKVTPSRDSKLQKLLEVVLPERLRDDPKVVIFTRYLDTMTYLAEQLREHRVCAGVEVLTIYGGLNERQRREVFVAFERAGRAVLVATDAISEGINLQHAAAQIIHYELPWNPNRLEQRNGRVDRFGQRKPVVTIRTLVMDETLDAAILSVLVDKAAQIRRDYGFSPPYFGDDTTILDLLRQHDVMLGTRQLSLFDPEAALWDAEGVSDGERDPFSDETLARIKGDSFYGQTHISLPEIEQRLEETAHTVGAPDEIRRFVFSGLSRFGCPCIDNPDGSYRLVLTEPALQTTALQTTALQTTASQTAGSQSAATGAEIPRATFDPEWALDDPDVTLLDVGHPLARRLIEEVKQHAFKGADHYGRSAYLVTQDVEEVTALFHLLVRYVVATEPVSIVEELLPVAVPVYSLKPAALGHARSTPLAQAMPGAQTRTLGEVQEALGDALAMEGLDELLVGEVEARRQVLVAERQRTQQAQEGGQPTSWLFGIADLEPGSYDLLAVTVLLPG